MMCDYPPLPCGCNANVFAMNRTTHKVTTMYKNIMTPAERASYDLSASGMRNIRSYGGSLRPAVSTTTTTNDQIVAYGGNATGHRPQVPKPESTSRWLQNPLEDPANCTASALSSRGTSTMKHYAPKEHAITTASFDALQNDITRTGILKMATSWKQDSQSVPKPTEEWAKPQYPKHCNCICKKCFTRELYQIGCKISSNIVKLMNSLGGFRAVNDKDVVFVVKCYRGSRILMRYYVYMVSWLLLVHAFLFPPEHVIAYPEIMALSSCGPLEPLDVCNILLHCVGTACPPDDTIPRTQINVYTFHMPLERSQVSGFGKPQQADLILLQVETGAPPAPPTMLTYATGAFTKSQCHHPDGLSSNDPSLA